MSQGADDATFEIDHIIARKHLGATVASSPCLGCFYCNSFKGSDLSGLDPKTRELTPLFNPRRHEWARHFRWQGPHLTGLTPAGRASAALLHIDDEDRAELRKGLIEEGAFPPDD